MKGIVQVNGVHLNYLTPLLKWRVLDLETLMEESKYTLSMKNFYRIIQQLEAKRVIQSYRDPFNRKKYIYLGKVGEEFLDVLANPTAITEETLIHDIKVSEIARLFVSKGFIDEVLLEHQIVDKRNFRNQFKVIPDAIFSGRRRETAYRMAFELELTRKSNQRLIEKGREYLGSANFNYVLYFFRSKNLMNAYRDLFLKEFGEMGISKMMFFYNEMLTGRDFELGESIGIFRNEEVKLVKLFGNGD